VLTGYCPKCGTKVNHRDVLARPVKHCPSCGHRFILPHSPIILAGCLGLVILLAVVGFYMAFRWQSDSPATTPTDADTVKHVKSSTESATPATNGATGTSR
jgi:hypothetical protein